MVKLLYLDLYNVWLMTANDVCQFCGQKCKNETGKKMHEERYCLDNPDSKASIKVASQKEPDSAEGIPEPEVKADDELAKEILAELDDEIPIIDEPAGDSLTPQGEGPQLIPLEPEDVPSIPVEPQGPPPTMPAPEPAAPPPGYQAPPQTAGSGKGIPEEQDKEEGKKQIDWLPILLIIIGIIIAIAGAAWMLWKRKKPEQTAQQQQTQPAIEQYPGITQYPERDEYRRY